MTVEIRTKRDEDRARLAGWAETALSCPACGRIVKARTPFGNGIRITLRCADPGCRLVFGVTESQLVKLRGVRP